MMITIVCGRKRNWFWGEGGYYGQPTAVRAKCIVCVAGVVRANWVEEREILVILQFAAGACMRDDSMYQAVSLLSCLNCRLYLKSCFDVFTHRKC